MAADRILVSHAGTLPRPKELTEMVWAKADGKPIDEKKLETMLRTGIADVVKRQVAAGIDSVNDGEYSKTTFSNYVRERLGGYEVKTFKPGEEPARLNIGARDRRRFPGYFNDPRPGNFTVGEPRLPQVFVTQPIKYVGQADLKRDIENFKAALKGVKVGEAYMPANTPGTIEHWLRNAYYKTDEEYLYAVADAMREEYLAITDAGFLLQIDDPDLPDGWLMYPDMSVAEYRKYAQLRVEALNHALRGIPREKIRLHVCWGSFHGPHHDDIPLKDIVDLIFKVPASSYSIEASNPAHEHEYEVFEEAKLPEGSYLVPGVVGHASDFIEHPDLVAQRLARYAKLVGKENVMAGTDCGIGSRVGHAEIAWAKLESMAEGARRATAQLWAR